MKLSQYWLIHRGVKIGARCQNWLIASLFVLGDLFWANSLRTLTSLDLVSAHRYLSSSNSSLDLSTTLLRRILRGPFRYLFAGSVARSFDNPFFAESLARSFDLSASLSSSNPSLDPSILLFDESLSSSQPTPSLSTPSQPTLSPTKE